MNAGNRVINLVALSGNDLTYSMGYSIRFRCLLEKDIESDDEDATSPTVAYDLGRQFGALMYVMAGPVVNNRRHVTLTMKLVPVGAMHYLSKQYANMLIEDNSNIIIERGVTSTFQTNEISVPCCDNPSCNRTSVLFPPLTIFVEWRPERERVQFVLEPPNPIGVIYVSELSFGEYGGITTDCVRRANANSPNYFPGPPAKTAPRIDDNARKERIRKRKQELADLRAREAAQKQPCPNGAAINDDDDSELAEVLQRSREETSGAAAAAPAPASPRPVPPAAERRSTSPAYVPVSPSYSPTSPNYSPQSDSDDEDDEPVVAAQ